VAWLHRWLPRDRRQQLALVRGVDVGGVLLRLLHRMTTATAQTRARTRSGRPTRRQAQPLLGMPALRANLRLWLAAALVRGPQPRSRAALSLLKSSLLLQLLLRVPFRGG
jgi:hypothetical protein